MTSSPNSGLALSLAASSLISEEDSQRYLSQAKAQRKPFVTFLIENEILDSKALADFCELEYGVPLLDLAAFDLAEIPQKYLNQKLIEKHHVLPIYTQGHTLYIAMSDPTNVSALEDFGFSFGLHTEALLVEENKLTAAIGKLLESENDALGMEDIDESEISDLEVSDENSRLDESVNTADDDAPIVKYINKILMDAIKRGASDLHFEPYEFKYRVRFRIDGILHEIATPPVNLSNRFSARLKVMARLDIAERRLPQDGRIKLKLSRNKSMDMRVNTLPTMWGEKIVIRLLDSSAARLNIEQLGFDDRQKAQYLRALSKPQGMILVTGPTGSGKTVSLYTGLNILNTTEVNISTAEDPVEINLPGVNQVQVNPKAGLTFASALRSFLRQDPDVVMVGEIRDLETAEIAIKAAQTGHLVLSTLHTNSAAETLTRMMNMGGTGLQHRLLGDPDHGPAVGPQTVRPLQSAGSGTGSRAAGAGLYPAAAGSRTATVQTSRLQGVFRRLQGAGRHLRNHVDVGEHRQIDHAGGQLPANRRDRPEGRDAYPAHLGTGEGPARGHQSGRSQPGHHQLIRVRDDPPVWLAERIRRSRTRNR